MDEHNNHSVGPWDDSVYGTGRTQPPKNHGSTVAVLLIVVIFLSGIITALGILNIRMFQRLRAREEADTAVAFALEQDDEPEITLPPTEAALPEVHPDRDVDLNLQETPAAAPDDEAAAEGLLPLQEIYEKSIPSVVSIMCTYGRGSSTGTGVVLTSDGYLVTNNHVIEGAGSIDVLLTDGRTFSAGIVGTDPVSDLAVLFIETNDLTPAAFGDSESIRVGDSVVAIGDPLGVKFRGTMTDGIISAINRDVYVDGRTVNLLQTNAALNSGNSGGPLINRYGQVIGINTMKIGAFTDDAGVEGIGFAIPSATVKDIVEQILAQGYVSGRPWLGIQGEGLSTFYQHFYRMPAGLYITEVESGSPAAAAGIEPGDILVSIDDQRIQSVETLNGLLYGRQVGDTVTVRIYRAGYDATVDIQLAEAVK